MLIILNFDFYIKITLEKLGLSPSPNGESLSFSYTIIHKIYILSDSKIKKLQSLLSDRTEAFLV